jgi:multiple sugar transport system ATP-binding protein
MNLAEGAVSDDTVTMGSISIPLARDRRPAGADSGRVIVGIRPEAFEDAEFASGDLPQVEVRVEVLEELGADAFVFFAMDAESVEVEGAVTEEEEEETSLLAADRGRALFAARVDPRSKAQVGETVRLAVEPSRLYFFSPDTGESLLGRPAAPALN